MRLAFNIATVILSILPLVLASATDISKQKTHYLDWTVSWKTVNPDGLKERQVISINDEWPLPVLRANKGDRFVVNLTNNLENPHRNSSIHWHGLFMNGTAHMDGATWLTQCPSSPGQSFIYNFTVDQPGTYWYHTHVHGSYPDGYRQMLLVDDDDAWFQDQVEEDIAFSLSDWYHDLTDTLEMGFMNRYNPQGNEPIPDSLLFNDTKASPLRYKVEPNKTYRLRIANVAALSSFYFYIPNHNLTIVEVDGVYTEPTVVTSIYVSTAQRYSVLFTTNSSQDAIYQMVQIADQAIYDSIPSDLQLNNTAWLYSGNPKKEDFKSVTNLDIYQSSLVDSSLVSFEEYSTDDIQVYDDMNLIPYDRMPRLPAPDHEITLTVQMANLIDGVNYAFFNGITWTHPKVPSLYSAISAPSDEVANNQTIYGHDTNSFILEHNEVVQLVLNNDDDGKHPFHLHGHNFQCLLRGKDYGDNEGVVPYHPGNPDNAPFPDIPMRRDTLMVLPFSHFVIRFVADNPGVWFFHCHVDWHLSQGLAVEFIEAPAQIRQNYKVHSLPESHIDGCRLSGLPFEGNAAANKEDFFNLKGQNRQAKNLPNGFTLRGYLAMVMCIICALIGIGSLLLFGLSDTEKDEVEFVEDVLQRPLAPCGD